MTAPKRKPGRPISGPAPKDALMQIRLSPAEKAKAQADADAAGMRLSEWIRHLLAQQ